MSQRLRIATRKSALALWQAEHIATALRAAHPGLDVELVGYTTSGDRWLSSPLSEIGGKGLFVKELEQAMLDGAADLAVHSMKDVPVELPQAFTLGAIGFRADVRDVLVSADGSTLDALPAGAQIGSASLRRSAQIKHRRPDLEVRPVRGNVNTRLAKLDAGDYDALVLASAGLERLGLEARIAQYFDLDLSLPAAGQGALGIECLADSADVLGLLDPLHERATATCVLAERTVSRLLGADCSLPIAAHAVLSAETIHLQARVGSPDGVRLLHAEASGTFVEQVGEEVAQALRAQGADDVLAALDQP